MLYVDVDSLPIDDLRAQYKVAIATRDSYSKELAQAQRLIDTIWKACQHSLSKNECEVDHPLIEKLIELGLQTRRKMRLTVRYNGAMDVTVDVPIGIDKDRLIENLYDFVDLNTEMRDDSFSCGGDRIDIESTSCEEIEIDEITIRK